MMTRCLLRQLGSSLLEPLVEKELYRPRSSSHRALPNLPGPSLGYLQSSLGSQILGPRARGLRRTRLVILLLDLTHLFVQQPLK